MIPVAGIMATSDHIPFARRSLYGEDAPVSKAQADAIIVAYQSADVLRECVASLRSDPSVDRIFIVNNSPGDGTSKTVEGLLGVTFLESPGNVGFGRANNSVRQLLGHEWVVLANPDTAQSRDTITACIRFLAERPQAALVGPRMVTGEGKPDRNSKRSSSLLRVLGEKFGAPQFLRGARSHAEHQRAHLADYVIGSFMVCRRSALDSVDWFDESIFLFGEDQDLCRRLRRKGWEIWFAPIGYVTHRWGHSWRQMSDEGKKHFRVSRARELRADSGWLSASVYQLLENVDTFAKRALSRAERTG
jgi:GT2 family glycosyltransferase